MKTLAYYILLCLILLSFESKSQDLIFYNNTKDTIKCKIIKDKIEFVEYTLPNDSNTYKIYQEQYDYYIQSNKNVTNQELITNVNNSSSLETPKISNMPKIGFGLGMGIDYGGVIGLKLSTPISYVSLFAGLGYNLIEAGFNIGIIARPFPKKLFTPTVTGMYGYNAVIIIRGAESYNQTYYGASIGAGIELRSSQLKNFFSLGILIPFRSQNFENDLIALKNNPAIVFNQEPSDALLSLGYHFVLK